MAPRFSAAHGAGELDRARIQQQLLGERRLAGVGMRDDRERPPPRHLTLELAECRGIGWALEISLWV